MPGAVALTSRWPMKDQAMAAAKKAQMVKIKTVAAGDAGVSRISNAAGRNSRSRPEIDRLVGRALVLA